LKKKKLKKAFEKLNSRRGLRPILPPSCPILIKLIFFQQISIFVRHMPIYF